MKKKIITLLTSLAICISILSVYTDQAEAAYEEVLTSYKIIEYNTGWSETYDLVFKGITFNRGYSYTQKRTDISGFWDMLYRNYKFQITRTYSTY